MAQGPGGRRSGRAVSRPARVLRRARSRRTPVEASAVSPTSYVERAFVLDVVWPAPEAGAGSGGAGPDRGGAGSPVPDDGPADASRPTGDLAPDAPRHPGTVEHDGMRHPGTVVPGGPRPPGTVVTDTPRHPGTVVPDATWDAQHPLAAALFGAAPGPALMEELEALDPADVDDAALVEGIAGWQRVASRTAALQARWLAELERRRAGSVSAEGLSDEVAVALGSTAAAADHQLGLAVGLDRLPAVADTLARGEIDVRRAHVLLDALAGLPDDDAARLAADLCTVAPGLTGPQLRARARRAVLAVDPAAAETRRQRARRERHVTLEPARDAMAWFIALLPADAATALFTTVTGIADMAAPDDPRSIGQRRADALVDLGTRFLDAGTCPDGPLPTRHGRRPHLQVVADLTTVLGLDENPAHLAGYGPVPAQLAREIASRASWQPVLVDADRRVLAAGTYRTPRWLRDHAAARDLTCTAVGCRMPADRCDLDHVEPFDPARPAEDQTTADNLRHLCRHHHRLKTSGRWKVALDPGTGDSLWTTPTGRTHRRPIADPPAPGVDSPRPTPGVDSPTPGVDPPAPAVDSPAPGVDPPGGDRPPDEPSPEVPPF